MGVLSVIALVASGIGLGVVLSMTGCASPSITAYRDNKPTVDIREYFNGNLVAFGTVQDFSGKVVSRFTATITGKFDKTSGTLDENFTFDDGTTERRLWSFKIALDGSFVGTAHDVIGEAKGKQKGNAIFMEYVLKRTIDGSEMTFTMDDRLYQIDDTYLMNQTKMKKFGITVAELNIGFHKVK
jgi:hypothetical protein